MGSYPKAENGIAAGFAEYFGDVFRSEIHLEDGSGCTHSEGKWKQGLIDMQGVFLAQMEGFLDGIYYFISVTDIIHQFLEIGIFLLEKQSPVGFLLLLGKPDHLQAEALEGRCHRQSFKEVRIK